MIKKILLGLAALLLLVAIGGGAWAYSQISAYEASVSRVYDIPIPSITHSTDPEVIARGRHLAFSISGCGLNDCHGADFGGGKVTDAGPVARMVAPNISQILPAYSDGEIARLYRHGVKKDGRTVRFMSVHESNWIPDSDLLALISFLRTVPPIERTNGTTEIKPLGKILDRRDLIPVDVARRIDHDHIELGPAPSATVEYGAYIGRLCSGCHGKTLSGGHIPGTPPDFPIPLNITSHATGLGGWTYDDFEKVITTGTRKNGKKLDPFMPIEALQGLDDTERHALWAYLQSVPPTPFGQR
jgi:hypothetical protein